MTTDASGARVSAERIERAAHSIDGAFLHTPQFAADQLRGRLGFDVVLKVETVNPIRSFKGRGADFLLSSLPAGVTAVACASAGNFGQGVAYAGRRRGVDVHVHASRNANPLKLQRMRELGAVVHVAGDDFDEAKEIARKDAAASGRWYVEDGREPAIAEGAGTIAVELARGFPSLSHVLVPVGNGSLISGIGRWLKRVSPATRVIAAGAAGAPAMHDAWRSGSLEAGRPPQTIADGIAARVPVAEAMREMAECVDDFLLVDDEVILEAMRLLFADLGLIAEPAGAVGLAAALAHADSLAGGSVAVPICGANLTQDQVRRWLL
jgi:threonine dehydratase